MHEFQPQLGDFVERLKPSIVVETGFMTGESAKFMLAAMEKGDFTAAASAALDSDWAKETPNRAQRVAAMIRLG